MKDKAPKAPAGRTQDGEQSNFNEAERRKEISQTAAKASAAQKKAKELREAAAGAGDPDERQKILERAIDAEIEAESFGKVAKYMRTGPFQGMAVGTGLGVVPGATLGALTGTLVGGTTSLITGGLGGALGTAAGAAHGPFINLGEQAGEAIRGVTGTIPGWEATAAQKKQLDKMVGQVNEQETPDEGELEELRGWGSAATEGGKKTWTESAASMVPSWSSTKDDQSSKDTAGESKGSNNKRGTSARQTKTQSQQRHPTTEVVARQGPVQTDKVPAQSAAHNTRSTNKTKESQPEPQPNKPRNPPRKLEMRSESPRADAKRARNDSKKPKKLEVRS